MDDSGHNKDLLHGQCINGQCKLRAKRAGESEALPAGGMEDRAPCVNSRGFSWFYISLKQLELNGNLLFF